MNCKRCNTTTERLIDERYCARCAADVRRLTAPRPTPAVRWRRESRAKDLTLA